MASAPQFCDSLLPEPLPRFQAYAPDTKGIQADSWLIIGIYSYFFSVTTLPCANPEKSVFAPH